LQFDGQPTNQQAGSVQGYNSLPGPPPLDRSELYQLWWRQELFDEKLIIRVGKMVPTADFNDVLRPVLTQDQSLFIPSVSGLIFTPVFVNPTLLGVMPGYYNSAYGVTTTFAPTNNFYFSYGVYDGNIANGTQTGMRGRNLTAIILTFGRRERHGRSGATICRAHSGGIARAGRLGTASGDSATV
jgi:porin